MSVLARRTAFHDIQEESHPHGLTLAIPKEELFDADAFFRNYEDRIVDREREKFLYVLKRDGKRLTRKAPKRNDGNS